MTSNEEYLVWDGSLDIGIKEIDEQHRNLVTILNNAHRAISTEQISSAIVISMLEELISYSATHFETEERLMDSINYPDIIEHVKEHEQYNRRTRLFVDVWVKEGDVPAVLEMTAFVKEWILHHVATVDVKLKPYVII